MGPIGWPELLIILVVVLLLFGTTRLAGLGKASGKAIREFKEETQDLKKNAPNAGTPEASTPAQPVQPVQPAPQELPYQQQPYQQGYPAQQPQYPAQPTQPPSVVYDAEVVDPERPNN
ncbi:MAG: twin-arginine translocase TatA/TatE family subunit [Acidobacteriota bacterium]|nr:twin-arginine translocase TatA/TatE family subunit [Acidobacteriota bacterium]NLH68805.1 twin-arginine translocase TatA/TatE family subunit [Brooklawnia sp.]